MAARVSKGSGELGGDQIEGRRAVLELLRAGKRRPRAVYLSSAVTRDETVQEIVERAGSALRVVAPERVEQMLLHTLRAREEFVAPIAPRGMTTVEGIAINAVMAPMTNGTRQPQALSSFSSSHCCRPTMTSTASNWPPIRVTYWKLE